jgi:hypothetical protein
LCSVRRGGTNILQTPFQCATEIFCDGVDTVFGENARNVIEIEPKSYGCPNSVQLGWVFWILSKSGSFAKKSHGES